MRAIVRLIVTAGPLCLAAAACAERSATTASADAARSSPLSPSMVRVSPRSLAGWTVRSAAGSSALLQVGAARGALGAGSARFTVGTSGADEASFRTEAFAGTPLRELSVLSYRTYVSGPDARHAAPHVTLSIDLDGDGWVDDVLIYRPAAVPDVWQTWDARQGAWWSTSSIGAPDRRGFRTLDAYISAAPQARVASAVVVGVWETGAPRPLTGAIDAITIGVGDALTVYDFEP